MTIPRNMHSLTYFISDLHLGAGYLQNPRENERRVVRWLRGIKDSAKSLYLLGDILDYWYEYRYVVPRGYVRFFGALSELADAGVEIFWFVGNHDIWINDYLPDEIGLRVIDGHMVREIDGKRFYLSHGDGEGKLKPGFKFIRGLFRDKTCQRLYSAIHPRWSVPFAHRCSRNSRDFSAEAPVFDKEKEPLIAFARQYNSSSEKVDYFIFGHRHVLTDYELGDNCRLIFLGDWIRHFSYAVFDGSTLKLESFNG